jgi:hypothetical protein
MPSGPVPFVGLGVTAGGTDGVPFLRRGAAVLPISWPGRYSHSPVEVADLRGVKSMVDLIVALATAEPLALPARRGLPGGRQSADRRHRRQRRGPQDAPLAKPGAQRVLVPGDGRRRGRLGGAEARPVEAQRTGQHLDA